MTMRSGTVEIDSPGCGGCGVWRSGWRRALLRRRWWDYRRQSGERGCGVSLVLIILLFLILCGGIGWGGRGYYNGAPYGAPVGLLGLVLLVALIVWIVRGGIP